MRKQCLVCLFWLVPFLAIAGPWSGTRELGNGWREVPALGKIYSPSEGPGWFYDPDFGWLYTASESPSSLWLYFPGWGWSWTNPKVYPWLYRSESFRWIWYKEGSEDPRWLYDSREKAWTVYPFDFLTDPDRSGMDFLDLIFTGFEELPLERNTVFLESQELEGESTTGGLGYGEDKMVPVANTTTDRPVQISATLPSFAPEGESVDWIAWGAIEDVVGDVSAKASVHFSFRVNGNNEVEVVPWGGSIKSLAPFTSGVASEFFELDLYEGRFRQPGNYNFYVGARGRDGNLFRTSRPIQLTVNRANPPEVQGDFLALSSFRPNPDGFGFRNYSNVGLPLGSQLDEDAVVRLLGPDATWELPDGSKVLKPTARAWWESTVQSINGGHCLGMAVAASRLFGGLPVEGEGTPVRSPSDLQENADDIIDVQRRYLVSMIGFWSASQYVGGILQKTTAFTRESPSSQVEKLVELLQAGGPPPVLGIYGQDGSGHAVTPWAVEDLGDGIVRIRLWDNNFPDDFEKVVRVDLNTEEWEYRDIDEWIGAPSQFYDGEFRGQGSGFAALPLEEFEAFGRSLLGGRTRAKVLGEGELIAERDGDRFGYDFATGALVEEIAGAELLPVLDEGNFPVIELPEQFFTPTTDLVVLVDQTTELDFGWVESGATESRRSIGVTSWGDDYRLSVGPVSLPAGKILEWNVHPSGTFALFSLSEEARGLTLHPEFTFAYEDEAAREGRCYEITELRVDADRSDVGFHLDPADFSVKVISLEVDEATGALLSEEIPSGEYRLETDACGR